MGASPSRYTDTGLGIREPPDYRRTKKRWYSRVFSYLSAVFIMRAAHIMIATDDMASGQFPTFSPKTPTAARRIAELPIVKTAHAMNQWGALLKV
jgi:hypothetical protein